MKIKAIKSGQTIKLLDTTNISDGKIIVNLDEPQIDRTQPGSLKALQFRQDADLEEL